MRVDSWRRFLSQINRPGDLTQRSAIAAVALGERCFGPALVNLATVAWTAWVLAMAVVLSGVFTVRGILQSVHVARTEGALYVQVVDAVLRQDVLRSSVLPEEEARAALFEGGHNVASLVSEGLPNLCANIAASVIFAGYVAVTQPVRIVGVGAVCGAAGVVALISCRPFIDVAQAAESAAWTALAERVSDVFDGRLEIVAGGRTDSCSKAFRAIASAWCATTVRAARVARVAGRLPLLALASAVGAAIVLDGMFRGQPSRESLGHAALLASMSPAFFGVAQGLQEMTRNDRRLQQMLALVTAQSLPRPQHPRPLAEVRAVELRDVYFAYEIGGRRQQALTGVSLTWRPGQLLAIAGPNGSGKSTCLRVLLGLGDCSGGAVLVDGVSLERIDMDEWRRSIAFLPQRPYLPPRSTVRECLTFVDDEVSDEVMIRALERVGLHPPRGAPSSCLDSRVDEMSVGQRQRVGLARALCRRAPRIMLDEPDANLDHAGILMVVGLIRELARDQMVLVAAHSPELLAAADHVIMLDRGQVRPASATAPTVPS